MSFSIRPITSEKTLPLRQQALWPNHPPDNSKVEGDATALHFGGFLDGKLVCVASLFPDGEGIRLRKFATDPDYQGRGYGSQMLRHLLDKSKACGAAIFWFDARESAMHFYESNGFKPVGARFFKSEVPYRRICYRLKD